MDLELGLYNNIFVIVTTLLSMFLYYFKDSMVKIANITSIVLLSVSYFVLLGTFADNKSANNTVDKLNQKTLKVLEIKK